MANIPSSTNPSRFNRKRLIWYALMVCLLLLVLLFLHKCGPSGCTRSGVMTDSIATAVSAPADTVVPVVPVMPAGVQAEALPQPEMSPAMQETNSATQETPPAPIPESQPVSYEPEQAAAVAETPPAEHPSEASTPAPVAPVAAVAAVASVEPEAADEAVKQDERVQPVSHTRADSVSAPAAQNIAAADTIVPADTIAPTDTIVPADTIAASASVIASAPVIVGASTATEQTATSEQPAESSTAAKVQKPAKAETESADTTSVQPVVSDTTIAPQPVVSDTTLTPQPIVGDTAVIVPFAPKNDVVALRTNLLYDAVLVPNIGIEVWLGKQFTLGADWFGTWLSNEKKNWYWQGYGGYLTLRYYFGRQAAERRFTGHHVGLYGSALTYDVEFGGKGYQAAKFGFGGGVEYGYSLQVHRCLAIDFTLGVGYQGGEYKTYQPTVDGTGHYVWLATYNRNWWGPTKAEISLKWLIAPVDKKKGGEQ